VPEPFRVGLTRDVRLPDGSVAVGDIGLGLLEESAGVGWEFLAESVDELRPVDIEPYNALLVFSPAVTARTLAGAERLTLLARLGVGYDRIDVEACSDRGIILTITPDGVRRPMAASTMAFVLALAHRLPLMDRLAREGRWEEGRSHMGVGLSGRALGLVGLGNIGSEIALLAKPFDLHVVAADPYVDAQQATVLGVELVALETLLTTADFVCVTCPLTEETWHLINAERLALMKPTAYLVNVARGPIVDQSALTAALQERRIAGAALDVFEEEPPDPADPLLALDNVILSPHSVGITDEWALVTGRSACAGVLDVAAGRIPRHVVNREVLERPALREKLRRYVGRAVEGG
jgi:D-3-phosphoglycerate dehydrogenase